MAGVDRELISGMGRRVSSRSVRSTSVGQNTVLGWPPRVSLTDMGADPTGAALVSTVTSSTRELVREVG